MLLDLTASPYASINASICVFTGGVFLGSLLDVALVEEIDEEDGIRGVHGRGQVEQVVTEHA